MSNVNVDWLYGEFIKLTARVERLEAFIGEPPPPINWGAVLKAVLEREDASEKQEAVQVHESGGEEGQGEQEGGGRVHRARKVSRPAGDGGQEAG